MADVVMLFKDWAEFDRAAQAAQRATIERDQQRGRGLPAKDDNACLMIPRHGTE
jgi:hypothetical protein